MRTRQRSSLVVAAVTALALAGCTVTRPTPAPSPTGAGQATAPVTAAPPSLGPTPGPSLGPGALDLDGLLIELEPFASVLGGPLAMSAPGDGSGRLFVAAQDGRVWVVEADGTVVDTPMVNLKARIRSGGEQGLLGLAVHPTFPADPRVFVNYTDEAGDSVIASLRIDPNNPNRLVPDSHRRILFLDQPYPNHNGGAILFGPDGYLYAFFGDGGGGGDPDENGQDRDALLGKILRIDVDGPAGDLGYRIPAGNPFVDAAGADEVWHLGVRNPWRASFDRETGDLWFGDVGQGAWEEIDLSLVGVGGLNFGWNLMEGAHCFRGRDCDRDNLVLPVTEYSHELGCTVIGGNVYRGSTYPAFRGAYVFADYCTGRIFAIDAAARSLVEPVQVGATDSGVSAFGEDGGGELYLMNLDGSIWRVVARER